MYLRKSGVFYNKCVHTAKVKYQEEKGPMEGTSHPLNPSPAKSCVRGQEHFFTTTSLKSLILSKCQELIFLILSFVRCQYSILFPLIIRYSYRKKIKTQNFCIYKLVNVFERCLRDGLNQIPVTRL